MAKIEIPELLTLKQASEILQVHPNTLRDWDKKGILKAVRIGQRGDRRYKKEDIKKLMEEK
jgi:excisionase family DNA binding protein